MFCEERDPPVVRVTSTEVLLLVVFVLDVGEVCLLYSGNGERPK